MPYATQTDLVIRFGAEISDLLDRDGDGEPDPGVADAMLEDASAEIDTILSARYAVPVAGSQFLKAACCDIARHRLHDDQPPEVVKERYQAAIDRLSRVAEGVSDLVGADGSLIADKAASARVGAVSVAPRARIFSDAKLAGYMGQ
jgi:phage gp36-like protein